MIRYTTGNLLTAQVDALVNTVNEKGVMGKGIALMFKERFPESARVYEAAAKRGEVQVGRVLVTDGPGLSGPRWIIHFPTKKHWRNPSKLAWVTEGLKDLARVIRELGIASIAVPPLGTGNGRLDWADVREAIERELGDLADVSVIVYQPTSEYHNEPKQAGVEELTLARALIAEIVRRYSIVGLTCSNLEVQKLAWFLQRAILAMHLENPLKLRFRPHRYGPYADQLRHLIDALDGSFLHSNKRVADASPYESIWFEESRREEVEAFLESRAMAAYLPALNKASDVIDGFESPHGLELLATVDWILQERHPKHDARSLRQELQRWPGPEAAGKRKLEQFDERQLDVALRRLLEETPIGG